MPWVQLWLSIPTEQQVSPAQTQSRLRKPRRPHSATTVYQKVRPASRNTHTPPASTAAQAGKKKAPESLQVSLLKTQGPSERYLRPKMETHQPSVATAQPSQSPASHTVPRARPTTQLSSSGASLVPQSRHEEIQYPWAGEGSLIPTYSSLLPQRICR